MTPIFLIFTSSFSSTSLILVTVQCAFDDGRVVSSLDQVYSCAFLSVLDNSDDDLAIFLYIERSCYDTTILIQFLHIEVFFYLK